MHPSGIYYCWYLNCWQRHRNFCWIHIRKSEPIICVEWHESEPVNSISVSNRMRVICVKECICWSKRSNLHCVFEFPTILTRVHLMCQTWVWGALPLRHTFHNSSVYVLKLFDVQKYSEDQIVSINIYTPWHTWGACGWKQIWNGLVHIRVIRHR